MFARRFSFVLAFLLAFMVLGVLPANAGERTTFTVTAMDWVTGDYTKWEVIGPNAHVEFAGTVNITASDTRINGLMTVGWSCTVKFPSDMFPDPKPKAIWGPCEGKWSINKDADPEPEWVGKISVLPQNTEYTVAYSVGHGQGEYAGLLVNMTERIPETPAGTHTFDGEILDPKSH